MATFSCMGSLPSLVEATTMFSCSGLLSSLLGLRNRNVALRNSGTQVFWFKEPKCWFEEQKCCRSNKYFSKKAIMQLAVVPEYSILVALKEGMVRNPKSDSNQICSRSVSMTLTWR